MTAPKPDSKAAVDFLKRWAPNGPWCLTAIKIDRSANETRTFRSGGDALMHEWIERFNGKRNLYYQVNTVEGEPTRKAGRADIRSVDWLHVDIDPREGEALSEERDRVRALLTTRLPAGVPAPTAVVFSGGGFQGFWRLQESIRIDGDVAKADDAARYNMRLETLFGADACHNVDRLMRLPGTINLPDAKKEKKGRTPTLAEVVEFNDRCYAIGEFTKEATRESSDVAPPASGEIDTVNPVRLGDVRELDRWGVSDRVKAVIVQGKHPDEPKTGDNSRSAWLFDVLCHLYRAGVPDQTVFGVVTDPEFKISESIRDKGRNATAYARRQMSRAKELIGQDGATFALGENGRPFASQHNIRTALTKMGVELRHDVFRDRLLVSGVAGVGPYLDDAALEHLWLEIERQFGFRASIDYFRVVVSKAARDRSYHPVRDYLDDLVWDGVGRLDGWLVEYAGAEDTAYTRAVGALVLVAAVRRVRQPGCKFDEMLVLESEQGTDKSSALKVLSVEEDWFSDDLPLDTDTKRVIETLAGRWIVEAAELRGMRRGGVEHLKAFLSRSVDRARMAYGRLVSQVPRQCVIVGTTNSTRYLRDGTGNRRFWPVRVNRFDLAALRRDRDQLWAEAAAREAAGASIRLDPSLYAEAAAEQEHRRVEDPFTDRLAHILGDLHGKLRNEDAWDIVGVQPGAARTQDLNQRLGDAMRELGWDRAKLRFGGGPEWCYVRGDEIERKRRIVVERSQDGRAITAFREGEHAREPF